MKEFCLSRNIRFRIQCNDPSQDMLESLQNFDPIKNPHIDLIAQPQADKEYRRRLSESNCVLLPYSPSIYGSRTSGILLEALASGIPSIVTIGTWLEVKSREFLSPNSCDFTTQGLVAAIEKMYWNYDVCKFSALYARLATLSVNNSMSVFRQLDFIRTNSSKKKVLIFYPWGKEESESSGAGYRLKTICGLLRKNNIEFKIVAPDYFHLEKEITYKGKEWVIAPFKLYKSRNTHIGIHAGSFMESAQPDLVEMIETSDYYIFLSTHMVLPVNQLVKNLDPSKCVIESFDLLMGENYDENAVLFDLQKDSLKSGAAFSLNKDEASKFSSQEITVTASNLATAKYEPKNLDFCDFIFKKLIEKFPNLKNGFVFFVGSDFAPNKTALDFLKKVSQLLDESKDPVIVIAGKVSEKYTSKNMISLGYVDDYMLESLYRNCAFFINPMFEGTGLPIKTVSALNFGAKVFATPLGARGIEPSNSIIIVDFKVSEHKRYAEAIRSLNSTGLSDQGESHGEQIFSTKDDKFLKQICFDLEIDSHLSAEADIEDILKTLIELKATLSEVESALNGFGFTNARTVRESILLSFLIYTNGRFTLENFTNIISGNFAEEIYAKSIERSWKNSRNYLDPQVINDICENGLNLLSKFSEEIQVDFATFLDVLLEQGVGVQNRPDRILLREDFERYIPKINLGDVIRIFLIQTSIFKHSSSVISFRRLKTVSRLKFMRAILGIEMRPVKFWAKLVELLIQRNRGV